MTENTDSQLAVILIGAMTRDRVIGQDDHMPWDIPEEYQTFVDSIRGQTVIMGRKSYEIFGADLTSEHAIVISRSQPSLGVLVVSSIEAALEQARSYRKQIFIAGGAQIYRLGLPYADRMYLSEIKKEYDGDSYFPEFDLAQWEITREEDHSKFIYRQWRRKR